MSLGFGKDDIANQEQLDLEESVKSRGGSWKKSEKDIYMAELNVLAKYAIADTDITLRLFNHFEKELKNYIQCIGIDNKLHICEPDKDICKCGVKVKNKKLLKNDYLKYSCYEYTY